MKYRMFAAVAAVASLAAVSAGAVEAQSDTAFAGAPTVSDAALATARGGTDAGIACSDCVANGVSVIRDNAFQNAAGVFSIIQNTGNQVFIDSVTVVTVSIAK
jgi:hypothetical protein